MNIAWLVLLPILFTLNSFFIGKLFFSKYKTLFGSYSFVAGWFSLLSIFSIISIPFYLIEELNEIYLYFILGVQIILVLVYLFNYKSAIVGLFFDINKIIYFIAFILIYTGLYCFYFFAVKNDYIYEYQNTAIIKNQSMWNYFLDALFNQYSVDKTLYYSYSLPIFTILVLTCCSLSFSKQNVYFNVKRFISAILFALVIGTITFGNMNNFKDNNYSLLFIALFFNIHFLVTKYKEINYKNNYLIYNLSILYMVSLWSNFIVVVLLVHILFIMSNYSMKNDFGLDKVIRSTIFVLFPIAMSIITTPIYVIAIVFVLFVLLVSIYYILKKNSNYTNVTYKIEIFLNNRIRYIVIALFFIINIMIGVFILRKDYFYDVSIFEITFMISKNQIYQDIFLYGYYVFYALSILFSIFYFIFKFKEINKTYVPMFMISLMTITVFNPITITIFYYVNKLVELDYYLVFLIYFIAVYAFYYRLSLKINYQNKKTNLIYIKDKVIEFFKYNSLNFWYYSYCFVSFGIFIIPLIFSVI